MTVGSVDHVPALRGDAVLRAKKVGRGEVNDCAALSDRVVPGNDRLDSVVYCGRACLDRETIRHRATADGPGVAEALTAIGSSSNLLDVRYRAHCRRDRPRRSVSPKARTPRTTTAKPAVPETQESLK